MQYVLAAYAARMTGVPVLDELMANAWRPVVTEIVGGWRYRWANGVTRRANSALALGGAAGEDLEARIAKAEAFYRDRTTQTMIQVFAATAPQSLVPLLRERGYQPCSRTLVEYATTTEVVGRTRPGAGPGLTSMSSSTSRWCRNSDGARNRWLSGPTAGGPALTSTGSLAGSPSQYEPAVWCEGSWPLRCTTSAPQAMVKGCR